jgi:hypothetical protein
MRQRLSESVSIFKALSAASELLLWMSSIREILLTNIMPVGTLIKSSLGCNPVSVRSSSNLSTGTRPGKAALELNDSVG